MGYFAQLDESNLVINVIVRDVEPSINEGIFVETFIDASQRNHYAGIGYTYDSVNDVFVPPKPYPSWKLVNGLWVAPVSYPGNHDNGKMRSWNEETKNWI